MSYMTSVTHKFMLAVNDAVYARTENDQWEVTKLFEFLVFLISPWRYR